VNAQLRPALLVALASVACSGEPITQGLEQPIRVQDAQFREGELPGLPPLTADDVIGGVKPTDPHISGVNLPNALIRLGESSRSISGSASDDATAVAVRLDDAGSGYWLIPTGNVDALSPGLVEWRLRASFGRNVTPGLHQLLFAAIDAQGRSGTRGAVNVCVTPEVPDNGNSCDPKVSPPALVISLDWDAPVDLDLRVITPSGKVVDSKHPSTALEDEDGDYDPSLPGTGTFDFDGFAHCIDGGKRGENLVFQVTPEPGTYLIYADLYDACGEAGVHFNASLHVAAAGTEPDTFAVRETFRQAGQFQAVHATGGERLGMFVTSFKVN
jgi:hypothetical protein